MLLRRLARLRSAASTAGGGGSGDGVAALQQLENMDNLGRYMWHRQRATIRSTSNLEGPARVVAAEFASARQSRSARGTRAGFEAQVVQLATQVHLSAERGYTCSRAQP